NGHVDTIDRGATFGFGVRGIADGAWGFAGWQVVSAEEADRGAAPGGEIARASALSKHADVKLAPGPPRRGTYRATIEKGPCAGRCEERIGLLVNADAAMRAVKGLRTTRANYEIWREDKLFISSEGSDLEQTFFETGCGVSAEAVGDGELQIRSYPAAG